MAVLGPINRFIRNNPVLLTPEQFVLLSSGYIFLHKKINLYFALCSEPQLFTKPIWFNGTSPDCGRNERKTRSTIKILFAAFLAFVALATFLHI